MPFQPQAAMPPSRFLPSYPAEAVRTSASSAIHTPFSEEVSAQETPQNIFNELLYLNKKFGVTQFDFVDDTITVNKNRIYELCNLMLSNRCNFKWMCNARVNTVDTEMLKMMKQAGCVRVEFGIESGDEQVLKNIKKAVTIEQIKNAHKMAKEAGLSIRQLRYGRQYRRRFLHRS